MAVREDKDRRMGGGSEKLLTLEEAARRLNCAPDDVEAMIQRGRLQGFRLGGSFLRVREKDVEAIGVRTQPSWPGEIAPVPSVSRSSFQDRLLDFFYYNDFYLLAALIILILIAVILIL